MLFMIGGTLLAIFIGMAIGSARRDRERDTAMRRVQDRLSERYKPEDIFASPWDRSAVAISFERGVVVLATEEADAEYPFRDLVEIEGLRDGTLLRRVRRNEAEAAAIGAGGKAEVVSVNTLDLRITVGDAARPVWIVRFFDWPAGGVSPGNVAFQQAAREAEVWMKRLATALATPTPEA